MQERGPNSSEKIFKANTYTVHTYNSGDRQLFVVRTLPMQQRIMQEFGTFQVVAERLVSEVQLLGRNRITLEIDYDNYKEWRGGKILEAQTENGYQAVSLLGHWFNKERPDIPVAQHNYPGFVHYEQVMLDTAPISDIHIPLVLLGGQARSGKYCFVLVTAAQHPDLSWREFYRGYIEQLLL